MIFHPKALAGLFLIEPERLSDERGFFARAWCRDEFEEHGLETQLEQCNISFNRSRGTLRGLHYQARPYEEAKLVRCTMGAIWDVAVDLRPDSDTFTQWVAETLSAENRRMLFIPKGFAHGYITLEDSSEVFYQVSESYHPESARGYRYDDPAFGIEWPLQPEVISDADRDRPDFGN